MARIKSPSSAQSSATIGFEAKLWLTADKLRNNMDAAEPSGARQTAKGSPQGERGGVHQFYTPSCVVRCLVEMLAPYTALRGSAFLRSEASPQVVSAAKDNGRIYDPACGSGGSLPAGRLCGVRFAEKDRAIAQGVVQSEKVVESHDGRLIFISALGKMNRDNSTAYLWN